LSGREDQDLRLGDRSGRFARRGCEPYGLAIVGDDDVKSGAVRGYAIMGLFEDLEAPVLAEARRDPGMNDLAPEKRIPC
jgi:hypothetical protein